MKNLKKALALVLALVMVLAVGTTAFAADMTGEEGRIGEFTPADHKTTQTDTVTIYKEITALNPETCVVNAPTITYNYTIGAGEAGKTITDNFSRHEEISGAAVNVSVTTKAGVGQPVITGTTSTNNTTGNGALYITPADQLNASEFGTANRFAIAIDFTSIDWATTGSGAGVYRYVITEHVNSQTTAAADVTAKNAAGIAEGTVANTLYMDVYVDGSGDIYGYVLFTNNDNIDGTASDAAASTAAGKIEGFVGSEPDDDSYAADNSAADKYYTFNFDVSKDVQNDAYAVSTAHQFPFSVTFANTNVTANVLPKVSKTGTATLTIPTTAAAIASFSYDGTATTVTNNLTIADDAVISFVGIPCGTTVTINEKNDVTGVTYSSVSTGAHTDAAAKPLNTGAVSNDATITCTTHITRATENHTNSGAGKVLFTNTLLEISPTGYVSRFAPYALILVAGIVLLIVAKKRKPAKDDEE